MSPAEIERVKKMVKTDNWVERMTTPDLTILAKLNPDLCEIEEEYEPGRKRVTLIPEARHKYKLYRLLRSKRRVPKDKNAESILKTMEG
jgi:hypothetical protein